MASENEIFAAVEAADTPMDAPVPSTRRGSGRRYRLDPIKLVAWKQAHGASIRATAERFGVSPATVKRYAHDYGKAAELERKRYEVERLDAELRWHALGLWQMYNRQLTKALSFVDMTWGHRYEQSRGSDREAAVAAGWDAAREAETAAFREQWERSMGPMPEYPAPW